MKDVFLELYPEGYIMGGLDNGFIVTKDHRIFFLPYDPMRQFRSPEEIGAELKELMEQQ